MGSRMMHLLIADRVACELGVQDIPRFLLGGVAPDAHQNMGVPKDESHFLAYVPERKRKVVEFERFAKQYAGHMDDAYVQGYLTHLIADCIWLEGIWTQHVFVYPKEQHAAIIPGYYRDFRRLNGRLLAWYDRSDLLSAVFAAETSEQVCEVDAKAVLALKHDLEADFIESPEVAGETLEEFAWAEILEYIDQSIRAAKGYLSKIPNTTYSV